MRTAGLREAPITLEGFLALTVAEVERQGATARGPAAAMSTWYSLANLMRQKGYESVREVGVPAATSWAVHLGLIERPASYAS